MSASRDTISRLLANNEKFASSFNGAPTMEQLQADIKENGAQPLFIRKLALLLKCTY
jgi:carbonic anhydrase